MEGYWETGRWWWWSLGLCSFLLAGSQAWQMVKSPAVSAALLCPASYWPQGHSYLLSSTILRGPSSGKPSSAFVNEQHHLSNTSPRPAPQRSELQHRRASSPHFCSNNLTPLLCSLALGVIVASWSYHLWVTTTTYYSPVFHSYKPLKLIPEIKSSLLTQPLQFLSFCDPTYILHPEVV